jgi:hypothetical protein
MTGMSHWFRFGLAACFLLILLSGVASPAGAQSITTFTNRTSWSNAVSGVSTINFETSSMTQGGVPYLSPPGFSDLASGVKFSLPPGSDGQLLLADKHFYNTPSQILDSQESSSGKDGFKITLPSAVTAIGFDFDTSGDTITISLPSGESMSFPRHGLNNFAGLTSPVPFNSLTVTIGGPLLPGLGFLFIDKVSFGEASPPHAVTIDNGLTPPTLQVISDRGGETRFVGAQGSVNVVFELSHFLARGPNVGAVQLSNTIITQEPTATLDPMTSRIAKVTSKGQFDGQNGIIEWTAVSQIPPGSSVYFTTLTFSSLSPFGSARFIQYADSGVPSVGSNDLVVVGTFNAPAFELVTMQHPCPNSEGECGNTGLRVLQPLVSGAHCVGWTAAAPSGAFSLRSRITDASPAPVYSDSPGDMIASLPGLAKTTDSRFPDSPPDHRTAAFGPGHVQAAIACDLDSSGTSATVALAVSAEDVRLNVQSHATCHSCAASAPYMPLVSPDGLPDVANTHVNITGPGGATTDDVTITTSDASFSWTVSDAQGREVVNDPPSLGYRVCLDSGRVSDPGFSCLAFSRSSNNTATSKAYPDPGEVNAEHPAPLANGPYTFWVQAEPLFGARIPPGSRKFTVAVAPFAYTLTPGPAEITVMAGQSASTAITAAVTPTSGPAQLVTFSLDPATVLPNGIGVAFSPASCTPSPDCLTQLTIDTASTTMPGNYMITVAGSVNGGQSVKATVSLTVNGPAGLQPLVAAVLPTSRSVQVGSPATAFVTLINAGTAPATAVGISLASSIPATFGFQTTDPLTNRLTGAANAPVDIPAGLSQSFVVSVTPTAAFAPTDVAFTFTGSNTAPVAPLVGVNTLLLSGSLTPVPDIVALAVTPSQDGIANIGASTHVGAFAVATVNVGDGGLITVSADTGGKLLPVIVTLCQTSPATGQCLAAPAARLTTQINTRETPTFGIFVSSTDVVPFDPASNRVFVRFADPGGVTRGATSVALRTQ